jgi:hypothetical protein
MRTVSTESVAGGVRQVVTHARPGTFLRRHDFPGSDRGVESALSRLASEGELIRARKGLYWRGSRTRFGMTRPSPLEVALAVAGPGSGPTGVAAANALGLSTQVPATVEVAAPGRAPEGPYARRARALRPIEVAALEILRDPDSAEVSWPAASRRITELMATGRVRRETVLSEALAEPHREARARAAELARQV